MNRISERNLEILENYCSIACNLNEDECKKNRTAVFDEFKRKIRLKRKYKVEKNFSYIYYDISNLDKILNGKVRILKESEKIYTYNLRTVLVFIKYFKLMLDDGSIVNLKLYQELRQVSICGKYNNIRDFECEIPVFVCYNLNISFTQNGITNELKEKYYDVEKMNYLKTSAMKNILKEYKVEISAICGSSKNIEIYYDEELVKREYKASVESEISYFLNEQLALGNISKKDLVFDKKITKEEKTTRYFTLAANLIDYSRFNAYFYNIILDAQKTRCELKNNSKVSIVVTKLENHLDGKIMTLDDFISKVLYHNFQNLCIKPLFRTIHFKPKTNDGETLTDNGENIPRTIKFNIKKENALFLPTCPTFKEGNSNKNTILSEWIEKDKESEKVYLTQYSYIENMQDEKVYKMITRMVYELKKGNFIIGMRNLNNVIFPSVEEKKCCVILLEEDGNIDFEKIKQNQFYNAFIPCIKTADKTTIINIFKEEFNKNKCKMKVMADEKSIFDDEKKADFSKTQKLSYDAVEIYEKYYEKLDEEEINALMQYYNYK